MKECDLDVMLARAQIGGFFFMLAGVFGLVFSLLFLHDNMNDKTVTIVTSVISVLVTVLTLMANYMYARQRPHTALDLPSNPDVSTPVVPVPLSPSTEKPK